MGAVTRAELQALRPGLVDAYDRALPRARAEILARLLIALAHEPLPGTRTATVAPATEPPLGRGPAAGAPANQPLPGPAAGAAAAEPLPRPGRVMPAVTPFQPVAAGLACRLGRETITDPVVLVRRLGWPETFAGEIGNSVVNLALAYADPPPPTPRPLLDLAPDLATVEQLVADGHPLHPCCRTRTGMSVADVLAYAPEHRPTLRLTRLRVPTGRWYGTGEPVLLAHPWQARHLREAYPWLRPDGETGPVRPLMSLRTVDTGAGHVKTTVDVQMTSAVRTVSPAALHNGPVLSALLGALTAGLPLTVLAESGAGAVLVDGEPSRHLAHLHRQAPRLGPGETVVPLGALAAADPYDGRPLLLHAAADPYAWWRDLCHLLFPPLLALLHRGVALEAHGQNTLVVLDRGRPTRIIYRDFGGVRVSPARLRAAGHDAPPLHGDLPTDDPHELRTKLAAAVLGTVAPQLIAVLTAAGADPAKLWATAAEAIATVATPDARALLTEPLPRKATTAMRLADDPLADVWAYHDNPLAA
ncbi:IucA/IucC family protein [Nucisporomicrobium flavum]|uniref:IucA/IucC family protein n=1 Tax=Nucisporomicrobium flavum TaxID=2785915 RepID=UPI0018F6128E|nr:IucA/IucC family protein [Nucisporomicrobium flavum]